jgi:hypothetical protein
LYPYKVLEELKSPLIQLPAKEPTYVGSSEYIHWVVQEPDEGGRRLSLLVTYYTGSLDDLYAQPSQGDSSGARVAAESDEFVTITTGGRKTAVPVGVVEFESPRDGRWILARFYHTDGRFCRGRREVGQIVRSSADRYGYLCNVVVRMDLDTRTTRIQAVNSVERFFEVLIPVLLEDHWPEVSQRRR